MRPRGALGSAIGTGTTDRGNETSLNFRWRPQLKDTEDELVLEAAVNGQADALVTHNVRDFLDAARLFPKELI